LGRCATWEPLNKSHAVCCIQNRPRARRVRRRIPSWGFNCESNAAPGLFSMQPGRLWLFGHFSALLTRARSLRILPLRSRLEKWPNSRQQTAWDLFSGSQSTKKNKHPATLD
jgi:hypothetical protein